jgi:hypothetical protein
MSRRKRPTADEKIACLLLENWSLKQRLGRDEEPIPHEIAKQMTAHQICSLVQWQHTTPWVWCKSNHPTVLTPMIIADHRKVTAEIDIPKIAKVKRGVERRAGKGKPKKKIRSRGFPTKAERQAFLAKVEERRAALS